MISVFTQTTAIIRLNACRFLKGPIKYVLILLLLGTVLPYILFKSLPAPTSSGSNIQEYQLGWYNPFLLDVEGLSPETQTAINETFTDFLTNRLNFWQPKIEFTTKAAYQNSSAYFPLIIIDRFDRVGNSFEYTISTIDRTGVYNFKDLWNCVSERYCVFSPNGGMATIAVLKSTLDQYFTNTTRPLQFYQKYSSGLPSLRGFNFYVDIFFIALGIATTTSLIEDNVKGLKFGLFMTGIRRSSYYIGTLFVPFAVATIYSTIVVLMSLDFWGGDIGPLIVLIFVTSYTYIAFFWTISHLTSATRLAQLAITLFVGGGYVTNYVQASVVGAVPIWGILLLCVNPRMGLSIYQYVATLQPYTGFSETSVVYGTPPVNMIVYACLGWMGFWSLAGIGLDYIRISKDETRSLYSLFKCGKVHPEEEIKVTPKVEETPEVHETRKVSIKGLGKIYKGATRSSLSDVSLEFGMGEIFGLLGIGVFNSGFNGAGKSTLINVLCGVLSPTTGYVKVFGMDARKQRFEIASRTGICSQDDVLYDTLTVHEHLIYFGLMRGVSNADIKKTVKVLTEDLQIDDKMLQTFTKNLSGGQKRKLCVALAFIHNPALVVLDEMSSGVDPENRRVIWNFLFKRKQNRAILLCTHFMDEADIVADRMAMLTKGQLVCVGSSTYLKNIYNTGYTLTIEKKIPIEKTVLEAWCSSRKLDVEFLRENEKIIEFQFMSKDIAILVDLLEKDKTMNQIINSFSIKENGLERIFSSKELVKESDLNISSEEKLKILSHLKSFNSPSFLAKTGYFFVFEFKRTISTLHMVLVKLFISIVLIIVLWLVFDSTTKPATTANLVEFNEEFVNKLVPSFAVLETNNEDLIAMRPSKYTKIDNTAGLVSMGTFLYNSTFTSLKVWQGYVGANFMVLNDIYPTPTVTSKFEFVSKLDASGVTIGTSILSSLIISQLYFDLLLFIVDEIVESKEKIKFLLLATGVPLLSYWIVTISRLILLVSPFVILAVTAIKSGFGFSLIFTTIYLLQIIFLGPLIGSAFPKEGAKGIVQLLRYGNVLILFVLMILVSIPQVMDNIDKQGIVSFFAIFGPWMPISIIFSSFYNKPLPDDYKLVYIAAAWLVLFFAMLVIVELDFKFLKKMKVPYAVGKEFVTLKSVSKTFGWFRPKKAVINFNLDVKKNEILALLGPNGCGKTSTLSMLTAQQRPSSGSIHVAGLHVASEKLKVISKIGLCPQFDDLLIPNMKVADHLRLFCAMNGVRKDLAEDYISLLLNAFGIASFKNVVCGNLSGGTKRKVSTAIAVMLPRSLVVLDESSSGLDPLARQKLWNTVSLLNQDRTTIITTHYVSETSFCDRIVIMSEGKLKCVDTEHSLAKRFAKGYKSTLYFKELVSNFNNWASATLFPEGCVKLRVDSVVGKVVVVDFISFEKISLAILIQRLAKAKRSGLLIDFVIGRMTLENVFLDIVKEGKSKEANTFDEEISIAMAPLKSAESETPPNMPINIAKKTASLPVISPTLPSEISGKGTSLNTTTTSTSPAKRAASMVPNPRALSISPAARANSKNKNRIE